MSKPKTLSPRFRQPAFTFHALEFLRPIAEWYRYMTEDQKKQLPIRVLNALDSLDTLMGKSRSYFDE
jgi:hypothetical protein